MNKCVIFCISLITVFQFDVFAGDQPRYFYGQLDKDQVQAMISSSVQAQQEIDPLLQQKEQAKLGAIRTLQLSQAATDTNKYLYEQACAQNIPGISHDAIRSRWDNCSFNDLSPLEKMSYLDMSSLELKIATLQNMSSIEQWKYFHENTKNHGVHNPSQLIDFLQCKLADCKQTLQDSVHAARSQQVAQWYLSGYVFAQNCTHQHRQIVEKLAQEEDVLRAYWHEYQEITNDLQELLSSDEQDTIDQEKNARLFQAKIVQNIKRNQAKKERKVERNFMSVEDALAQHARRDEQERFLAHAEELRLLYVAPQEQIAQQALIHAEEQVKKDAAHAKNKLKKQRQKQQGLQAQEQLDEFVGLHSVAVDIDQVTQKIQNESDALLRSRIEAIENIASTDESAIEPVAKTSSDIMYQKMLVTMQGNTKGDSVNYELNIQDALKMYAHAVCDENMTYAKIENMKSVLSTIFEFNKLLGVIHLHMSSYVSSDQTICKKINDRFTFLYEKYEDREVAITSNLGVSKALCEMTRHALHIEIADLDTLLMKIKNKKIKSDADKESAKKFIQLKLAAAKKLSDCMQEYNQYDAMAKEILIFRCMKIMQGMGGILNTDRLLSSEDFSTWEQGNFTEAFITQKMKDLHKELVEAGVMTVHGRLHEFKYCAPIATKVEIWIKDVLDHVGLSPYDRDEISREISKNIISLVQENMLGHLDMDNLEYSLHKFFVEYCKGMGSQYTLLQINDVTKIQLKLVDYIASLLQSRTSADGMNEF